MCVCVHIYVCVWAMTVPCLGLWLWPRRRKTAHEKNLFSVQWLCFVVLFVCWTSNSEHTFVLFVRRLALPPAPSLSHSACVAAQPEHSAASWKSECRCCCCCCFLHLCNITTSGRNVVFGRKPNWTFTFCLNALFVHLACIVVFLLITNGKYRQMNGNSRACVCVCIMSNTLLLTAREHAHLKVQQVRLQGSHVSLSLSAKAHTEGKQPRRERRAREQRAQERRRVGDNINSNAVREVTLH